MKSLLLLGIIAAGALWEDLLRFSIPLWTTEPTEPVESILPTFETITADLEQERPELEPAFLALITEVQGHIYHTHKSIIKWRGLSKHKQLEYYKDFYKACSKGLTNLWIALPSTFQKQHSYYKPLFDIPLSFHDLLNTTAENYKEALVPAFVELAKPFNDYPLLNTIVYSTLNLPREPEFSYYLEHEFSKPTATERAEIIENHNRKERAQKKYEKEHKAWETECQKLIDAQPPLEKALYGSPYWPWINYLTKDEPIVREFAIPPHLWFEGTWIVAPQGRGKTNLLRHLILRHLPDACIIIMDAKGDTIRAFERYLPIKERLVYLNPSKQHPRTRRIDGSWQINQTYAF